MCIPSQRLTDNCGKLHRHILRSADESRITSGLATEFRLYCCLYGEAASDKAYNKKGVRSEDGRVEIFAAQGAE